MNPKPSKWRLFGAPLWTVHTDVIIHGIRERLIILDAKPGENVMRFKASCLVLPHGRNRRNAIGKGPSLPQLINRALHGGAWYIKSFERKRLSFPSVAWPPFAVATGTAGVAITLLIMWALACVATWAAFVVIGLALCFTGHGA